MISARRAQIFALLAPYLMGAFLLVALPAGISLYVSFTRYDGVSTPVWVGLQNFQLLRIEPLFWVALINSLIYISQAVLLRTLAALGLALLYNQPRRATGLYRAIAYLPTVIPDTAYALVWLWILNPLYGPLNLALRAFNLPAPAWLTDTRWAIPAIVLMSLFQVGEGLVILLAGLRHIPRDLKDSARVDGANALQPLAPSPCRCSAPG